MRLVRSVAYWTAQVIAALLILWLFAGLNLSAFLH